MFWPWYNLVSMGVATIYMYAKTHLRTKVSNGAKIRNRYNQVPHLTQDTNGKVTNSQKTPQTRAKRPAPPPPPQQATTKHTQTNVHKTQQTQDRTKTQKIHKRSTALERPAKYFTGGLKPV